MARTIGVKFKNQIKRIIAENKKKGIINKHQLQEIVREALPVEAFDTWEGAYSEINMLVWDAN